MKARVRSIQILKQRKPRLVCMTGTPVSEEPLNAYSLIRLVEPELAVSRNKFNNLFVVTEDAFFGGKKVQKVKEYRNLDRLRELMSSICIRRTLDEVEGMPEKLWVDRIVELNPDQRRAYNKIAKASREEVAQMLGMEDIGSKALRLRQVLLDPEILGIDAASSKFDALEDLLEEILADPMAKVVVWMSYTASMTKLATRFKQYSPILLYGETEDSDIEKWSKTFDHSENRVVFATPQKGGTGLNFLNRARYAIYLDLPWSFILYQQSQDRLVRRTNVESKDPVEKLKGSPATLMRLRVPFSVDDLAKAMLDKKLELAEGADVSTENLRITREQFLSFVQELK